MKFFFSEKPMGIFILLPVLISIHITSIFYVKLIGVSSILLFSLGNLFLIDTDFIELWIISIYSLIFLLIQTKKYYTKEIQGRADNRGFKEGEYIYNREFKEIFNYDEFKNIFMKNCEIRRYSSKKKFFFSEGGPFDKIFYFISVPNSVLITLKHKNTSISYLKESSWIGVVEFMTQVFDDSQRRWLIGLEMENVNEEEVIWIEWNKDYFHKVVKKQKDKCFLKKLLILWMKYLSIATYKMDDHIATALGVISKKKSSDAHTALPLYRHAAGITNKNLNEEEEEDLKKLRGKNNILEF